MMTSEEMRYIRDEIRNAVNVVMTAQAGGQNSTFEQTIANQYAGQAQLTNRPIMFPYGMVSRMPPKTGIMTARLGDHPGNRTVLGALDENRPDCPELGTVLYNAFGAKIVLDKLKIQVGSEDADEPLVLGKVMLDFAGKLLDAISQLTVVCTSPGNSSSPPVNIAAFQGLKAQFVVLQTLVSKSVFTQNIITPE